MFLFKQQCIYLSCLIGNYQTFLTVEWLSQANQHMHYLIYFCFCCEKI